MTTFEEALFPLRYADGAARELLDEIGSGAVICAQPEPWALLAPSTAPPLALVDVVDVDRVTLDRLVARIPQDARSVVGVGGGQALDTAKYLAGAHDLELYQVPTIVSVDAAFTEEAGVRIDGRVRYLGRIRPELVVVDPELVRQAPKRLNRAGCGDILSCHTALHDWCVAAERGEGPPWDEGVATLGRTLLAELAVQADAIGEVGDDGIRFLAHAMHRIGAGCTAAGHPRFEEGSEHFFAYLFEALTGEHRIHGELVALGIVTMACVQGNDPRAVVDVLRRARVGWTPAEIGVDRTLFDRILTGLPGYCAGEGLWPSVVEATTFDAALLDRVWHEVEGLAGSGDR